MAGLLETRHLVQRTMGPRTCMHACIYLPSVAASRAICEQLATTSRLCIGSKYFEVVIKFLLNV